MQNAVSTLYIHSVHYSVCLFVSLYWFVQEGWLSPLFLFATSTSLTALVFLVSLTMDSVDKKIPGVPLVCVSAHVAVPQFYSLIPRLPGSPAPECEH